MNVRITQIDGKLPKSTRSIHFLSQTTEWSTPACLFRKLDEEFGFDFDPCPLGGDVDGTSQLFSDWKGRRVFCNPPYGPQLRPFLERWHEASLAVYLLPARTDTRWFHQIVLANASEIRFIKGRLKFSGAQHNAPFPSMVVVFKGVFEVNR